MATHNGVKKHHCEHCPAAFSCSANLKLHLKGHMDERDYTCHVCGKGFLRPDALKKHLLCYHGNIKAFHCKICNKMFKGHLPQHMRTHQNEKPHGCAQCGSSFSQRSQLVVHQRIHSGERPYRCQVIYNLAILYRIFIFNFFLKVCWQAFAHSGVLKLHIRKHTGEKPFKCLICVENETAFSQLPHLKKHMQAIHGKDKPYMCSVCNNFYKTKVELQSHSNVCLKLENENEKEEDTIVQQDTVLRNIEPPMLISRMRLLVVLLLKKISTEDQLKNMGYEKRLIDNVLIGSLKIAKRTVCEDTTLSEAERLKANVKELLEWTVPTSSMDKFKQEQRSIEELLEVLTGVV